MPPEQTSPAGQTRAAGAAVGDCRCRCWRRCRRTVVVPPTQLTGRKRHRSRPGRRRRRCRRRRSWRWSLSVLAQDAAQLVEPGTQATRRYHRSRPGRRADVAAGAAVGGVVVGVDAGVAAVGRAADALQAARAAASRPGRRRKPCRRRRSCRLSLLVLTQVPPQVGRARPTQVQAADAAGADLARRASLAAGAAVAGVDCR